jgi:hypothetical protein
MKIKHIALASAFTLTAVFVTAQAHNQFTAPAGYLNIHNDTGDQLLFKCPFMKPISVNNGTDGEKLYWNKGALSLLPRNVPIKCSFFNNASPQTAQGYATLVRKDTDNFTVTLSAIDSSAPFPYAVSYNSQQFNVGTPFPLKTADNVTIEVAAK